MYLVDFWKPHIHRWMNQKFLHEASEKVFCRVKMNTVEYPKKFLYIYNYLDEYHTCIVYQVRNPPRDSFKEDPVRKNRKSYRPRWIWSRGQCFLGTLLGNSKVDEKGQRLKARDFVSYISTWEQDLVHTTVLQYSSNFQVCVTCGFSNKILTWCRTPAVHSQRLKFHIGISPTQMENSRKQYPQRLQSPPTARRKERRHKKCQIALLLSDCWDCSRLETRFQRFSIDLCQDCPRHDVVLERFKNVTKTFTTRISHFSKRNF